MARNVEIPTILSCFICSTEFFTILSQLLDGVCSDENPTLQCARCFDLELGFSLYIVRDNMVCFPAGKIDPFLELCPKSTLPDILFIPGVGFP